MTDFDRLEIQLVFTNPYQISGFSKPDKIYVEYLVPELFRSAISNKTISDKRSIRSIPIQKDDLLKSEFVKDVAEAFQVSAKAFVIGNIIL